MPYVYILECADKSYYTGSTKDINKRIWEHQNGLGANYTKKRLPVKLVYSEAFDRLMMRFTERNKFKDGAEQRRKR